MRKLMKCRSFIVTILTIMFITNFTLTITTAKINGSNLESIIQEDVSEEISEEDSVEIDNEVSNNQESNEIQSNEKNEESEEVQVDEEKDNGQEFSSSDKAEGNYELKESEYIEGNGVKLFSEDDEDRKRVLLIQDNLPWNTNSNQVVLSGITDYDLISTSEFLNVDLSLYGVVVLANDQSFDTYENYVFFKEYLETFASIGGVIVYGACDGGWAGGNLTSELPGGVTKKNVNNYRNYIVNENHSIITGELTDKDTLINDDLYENYVSHIGFDEETFPAGTQVIIKNEKDDPTLIEYPLGEGRVIASGLTWEYNYVHGGESHPNGGNRGYYAKKAMDDLFAYAIHVSKVNPDEVYKLEYFQLSKYAHNVYIADAETFEPITSAIVTINGKHGYADEYGVASVFDVSGEHKVEVVAEGYKTKRLIYDVKIGNLQTFYLEKAPEDGKPYITMASSTVPKNKDLLTQTLYFEEDDFAMCNFTLEGEWNGAEKVSYVVYQEGKSFRDYDGEFSFAPGEVFEPGKKIYALMVGDHGEIKSDPVELKIRISEKSKVEIDTEDKLTLFKEPGFTIDDDLPIIGGWNFNIDLDLIPVGVVIDENKVKIGIGVTGKNKLNEEWDKLKKAVDELKDTKNTYKKLKNAILDFGGSSGDFDLNKDLNADLDIIGYAEGILDDDGDIEDIKGYAVVESKIDATITKPFIVGPVPCYFEIGGGVKLSVEGGVRGIAFGENGMELEGVLNFTPKFTIGAGVGLNGAISVGAEGEVESPVEYDFPNRHLSINLEGSMKLKASLLYVFKAQTPAIKGTWVIIDEYRRNAILEGDPSAQIYNIGSFQKLERDYLNNNIPISYDLADEYKVLEANVLPSVEPQVQRVGDNLVMVYQIDDSSRNDNNRTKLVYSVYKNGSWSDPVAVWDNGNPDFSAILKSYNDELYLVWQKASQEIPNNGDEIDDQINEALSLCEIAYAKWDNSTETFVDMQYITNNDTFDMLPSIAVDEDEIYISWINNSDLFGDDLENKIVYVSSKKDNSWTKETIIETINSNISGIDSEIINNELSVAYSVDTDKNINTTEDIEISIASKNSSIKITNNEVPEFSPKYIDDSLYWYSNNTLMSYDLSSNEIKDEGILDVTPDYKFIRYSDKEFIMWLDSVNEENDSIKVSIKKDKGWSNPIKIFESEDTIESYDGYIDNDGKWNLSINLLKKYDEVEVNSLVNVVKEFNTDTELILYSCDDEDRVGSNQTIEFEIINQGLKDISKLKIAIYNSSDMSLISEKNISCSLPVGENEYIVEEVNVGEVVSKKDIVITVEAEGEEDSSNNREEVSIGYADVGLEVKQYEVGNQIILEATVYNDSDIPTNSSISLIEDKEDGLILDMKNIGTITSEDVYVYRYSINKELINYNDNRYKSFYIKVDCLEPERITVNNSEWIVIDSVELEDYDGEPGPEVPMINVTGVEISPVKNLTLDLSDNKTFKLEANIYPENASWKGVTWTSSNEDVVVIDNAGNLEAVGEGNAVITVTTIDGGFTDTCIVNVVNRETTDPGEEEKPGDGDNTGEEDNKDDNSGNEEKPSNNHGSNSDNNSNSKPGDTSSNNQNNSGYNNTENINKIPNTGVENYYWVIGLLCLCIGSYLFKKNKVRLERKI